MIAIVQVERITVQRQIIYDTLRSVDTHPTVDELYVNIHEKHPSISKATVYRNLRHLAERGAVLQLAVPNDVVRYDGCVNFHHHFVCDTCSKVFDIYIDEGFDFEDLSDVVKEKYKHAVDTSATMFFGTCADCEAIQLSKITGRGIKWPPINLKEEV